LSTSILYCFDPADYICILINIKSPAHFSLPNQATCDVQLASEAKVGLEGLLEVYPEAVGAALARLFTVGCANRALEARSLIVKLDANVHVSRGVKKRVFRQGVLPVLLGSAMNKSWQERTGGFAGRLYLYVEVVVVG
jgi:hypothetical protein